MKDIDRNYFYLSVSFLVLTAAYLLAEYLLTGKQFGFPLDDVWIHLRFAENFAKGHFYEYNIGEPTPGTTSPLWVIVLSIPFLFSEKLAIPFAFIVSSLFFLLTVFKTYKLAKRAGLDKNYALLSAFLTLLCGRLLWSSLSGMEITLFCLISIIIVLNHLKELETKRIELLNGFLIGLAFNVRPETYLLALIYYIVSFFLLRKVTKGNLINIFLSALICILLILPYPVFSYIHTGSFLPSTFKGQGADFSFIPNFQFIWETGKLFVKDNLIITMLWFSSAVYFLYSLIRKSTDNKFLLINLWIFLLPLVSSFITPNWRHHGRYLIPLIPFINIVAINILLKFFSKISGRKFRFESFLRRAPVVIMILFSLNGAVLFAFTLGWNVENINDQQIKIANWLKTNLPDEKTFALNDIGAITYITKKPIVDMAGLVTPEIFKFQSMNYNDGAKHLFKLIKNYEVNYMIVYPDWFPYIMTTYSTAFEQVYSAKLEKNTICGGIEMFVYKIHWDRIELK